MQASSPSPVRQSQVNNTWHVLPSLGPFEKTPLVPRQIFAGEPESNDLSKWQGKGHHLSEVERYRRHSKLPKTYPSESGAPTPWPRPQREPTVTPFEREWSPEFWSTCTYIVDMRTYTYHMTLYNITSYDITLCSVTLYSIDIKLKLH